MVLKMAEHVFYMRGFPSTFLDGGFPHHVVEDLKKVAGISGEQAAAVRQRLAEASGFLSSKTLLALLREELGEGDAATATRNVIRNLDPGDAERWLDALEKQQEKKDIDLDEAVLDKLRKTLPLLIQHYPALDRLKKAENLAVVTGERLESIELICDLRPVLDGTREHIEGIMPYTRLHIVTTGADGLPNAFEAELTQQQVHDLADKADKAKTKVQVLCEQVKKWLPDGLPDLPLTRAPRKEPQNG